MNAEKTSEILGKRKQKLADLKRQGINLFPNDFSVLNTINDIHRAISASPNTLTETAPIFTVAGRMMAINRFGKTCFIRFRDRTGQLQALVQ